MKKYTKLLLLSLIGLTGCNVNSSKSSEVSSTSQSSSYQESSISESSSAESSSKIDTSSESSSSSKIESSSETLSSSASSSEQIVITSGLITNTKTDYEEGDTLETSALSFKIGYSDGTTSEVAYSDLSGLSLSLILKNSNGNQVELNSTLEAGTYSLALVYGETTLDTIQITVMPPEAPLYLGTEVISKINNGFTETKSNVYVADDYRSVKVLPNSFENGTFSIKIAPNDPNFDHFMFFNYDCENETYYSFGFNAYKKAQITYFNGTSLNLVKYFNDIVLDGEAELAIALDKPTGSIDFWVDGFWIFGSNITLTKDAKAGFYSGSKGSEFFDMKITNDSSALDSNLNNFKIANGNASVVDDRLEVAQASTVAYHKTKEFVCGEFEATVVTKDAINQVGLVLCLDNNGMEEFFRTDVTYYYLGLSIQGTLYLQQVKDGALTTLKAKNTAWYDSRVDHTIKVIKDLKTIHVFLDGIFQFSYSGTRIYQGKKFGVATSCGNTAFYNISVKNYCTSNDAWKAKYDVTSGKWYGLGDLKVASAKNSMILAKQEFPQNGTLNAEVSMGKNVGTSFIFRLTKPSSETFFEDETGLSYYALEFAEASYFKFVKYVDGVRSEGIRKYYPNFMNLASQFKVVMNGNKINVYLNQRCIVEYIDENPLTGSFAGFKSVSSGAALFGDITYSESTTLDTCDYLIFGHSYTQLWHRYKEDFASLTSNILDIGIGGAQSKNMADQYLNEIASYKAKWGIYWNGINDIDSDIATEDIMNLMKKCVNGIKEINPDFKCALLAASICTAEKPAARIPQIKAYNQALKAWCDETDWLVYVDCQDVFCDGGETAVSTYFVDGLHPTVEGYKLVAPLVIDAIKNASKGE